MQKLRGCSSSLLLRVKSNFLDFYSTFNTYKYETKGIDMKKLLLILFIIPNIAMADSGGIATFLPYIILFCFGVAFAVFGEKNDTSEVDVDDPESNTSKETEIKALIEDFKYTRAKAVKAINASYHITNLMQKKDKLKKGFEFYDDSFYNPNLLQFTPKEIKDSLFASCKARDFHPPLVKATHQVLHSLAQFMTGVKNKDVVEGILDFPLDEDASSEQVDEHIEKTANYDTKEYEKYSKRRDKVWSDLSSELDSYVTKKTKKRT